MITDPLKCTGCQACRLICPEQCIGFTEDKEGFPVPEKDMARCTDCGECASLCPENNRSDLTQNECVRVVGAKYKNDALLSKSASGGGFAGIAKTVLEKPDSAVFGCAFDDNMIARHVYVTDLKEITPLQNSKYVQSDVGDAYLQARALLDEGKTVFFTGMPCQIAGLYAFLGRDHDNLLTADLICHGVPSPMLFRKYLGWLGRKHGGEITDYDFRCKEKNGWGYMIKATIKTGTGTKTKTIIPYVDPYFNSFLSTYTFRECCYACQYANSSRTADLTLGDFWGVEESHPEFHDLKGVSVVLINTKKGENFFSAMQDDFDIVESTYEKAAARNWNLSQPSLRPPQRDLAYSVAGGEEIDFINNPAFRIGKRKVFRVCFKASVKQVFKSIPLLEKMYRAVKGTQRAK